MFTTKIYKPSEDLEGLVIWDKFENLVDKFDNYHGEVIFTICAPYAEPDEDHDYAELISVTYGEKMSVEILAQRDFRPPENFDIYTLLKDLGDCAVAMTNFEFCEPDKMYVSIDLLDYNDTNYFLETYFASKYNKFYFEIN